MICIKMVSCLASSGHKILATCKELEFHKGRIDEITKALRYLVPVPGSYLKQAFATFFSFIQLFTLSLSLSFIHPVSHSLSFINSLSFSRFLSITDWVISLPYSFSPALFIHLLGHVLFLAHLNWILNSVATSHFLYHAYLLSSIEHSYQKSWAALRKY